MPQCIRIRGEAMKKSVSTALAARIRLTFDPAAATVLEKVQVHPPYGIYAVPQFDVLANRERARFSLLAPEGRPIWTIVRRGDSRAATLWDHALAACWELAEEHVQPVVVRPDVAFALQEQETRDGVIATLHGDDEAIGEIRIELEFARNDELAPHAPALLRLLFGGPSCHRESGFPLERLESLGCLVAARTIVGKTRVGELVVDLLRVAEVKDADFRPPEGFSPWRGEKGCPEPGSGEPQAPRAFKAPPVPTLPLQAPVAQRSALVAGEEQPTPECVGSTRQGRMAFLFHQDALDHTASLVNQLAPFLGTATIGGGTLILPWAAGIRTLAAVTTPPFPPGAGLATLLHVPRVTTPPVPPSGGNGLLDVLAVEMIRADEARGESFLQEQAKSGALLNTMRGWTTPLFPPLPTLTISDLFAAGGSLAPLTTAERVAIADAHEFGGLGTLRFEGLPTESDEAVVPGVATGRFLGVTGSVAFGAAPGPVVPIAQIGSTGEILFGVTPPPTMLTAAAVWRLDPLLVASSYVAGLLGCIFFPLGCAIYGTVATVLSTFMTNQLTTLNARSSGVSFLFELRFEWDATRGVLTPTVKTLSTAGTISVIPSYTSVPNLIRLQIEDLVTATGNAMGLWLAAAAKAIELALQGAMRQLGCEFPPPIPRLDRSADDPGPRAVSGSVQSDFTRLLLEVELPAGTGGPGPFTTQAADADELRRDLLLCHGAMRSDLARVPGGVVNGVGVYAGMGINQNALNHYMHARWKQGGYGIEIRDPNELARLSRLAPPGAFATVLSRVHAWPASCPRVEIAETPLANGGPTLRAFFDDWRICFEGLPARGDGDRPGAVPTQELSFSCRAAAVATVDFPFLPQVLFDPKGVESGDEWSWQLLDMNAPMSAQKFDPALWRDLAFSIATRTLERFDVQRLVFPAPATPVRTWRRPLPNARQQVFEEPGTFYMEVLARHRALHLLPALDTPLLEFCDGSGAPLAAALLSTSAVPVTSVTLAGLTPAQGATLRPTLTRGRAPEFFIPP
jgi:hypothetical protein